MHESQNKTIAKNTVVLYMRSIVLMLIGLYTSRIVLQALGITDFGIYNAVGGIVGMMGFVSASLSNATSRFITIAIGKGDEEHINRTFGNIKILYYGLCIVIFIFAETLGLWFLYNKMIIPENRLTSAFWVYQYSILSTLIGLMSVPYNSAIIAHERMSAFTYMSLLDGILKLLTCYVLLICPADKLILYGTFLFCIGVVDQVVYVTYCRRNFPEVSAKPRVYRKQMKEIFTISGWTLSGNVAYIMNTQGLNLLLNIFFGPIVNAARGIALQVQGVIGLFISNFQTAVNPQITKNYGIRNYERMNELLEFSSRFSYLLMFLLSLPILIQTPIILKWWLGVVPPYSVTYLRLILINYILCTLSNPLWISVLATGKLKKYQIYDNMINFLILPISWVVLKNGAESYWVFLILIIAEIGSLIVRIWIVLPLIQYKYSNYFKEVLIPLSIVSSLAPILPFLISNKITNDFFNFSCVCISSFLGSLILIWIFALKKEEQIQIKKACMARIKSIRNK